MEAKSLNLEPFIERSLLFWRRRRIDKFATTWTVNPDVRILSSFFQKSRLLANFFVAVWADVGGARLVDLLDKYLRWILQSL